MDDLNFSGQTIAVTGASSGLGYSTAIFLANRGAQLLLIARDEARLSATMDKLLGNSHRILPLDLSDCDLVPLALKKACADRPLSGLVHCAGQHFLKPLRIQDAASVRSLLLANVESTLGLAKAFRQKGVRAETASMVFLSSVAGIVGQPAASAYSASKGAIEALTKSVALELAPEGIRVNAIAPAVVWTEMTEKLKASMPADNWAEVEKMHPLGLGRPEDIAGAVAFLLSPLARWITGTTLVVDGGYTAH